MLERIREEGHETVRKRVPNCSKKEDVDVLRRPNDPLQFLRQYLLLAALVLVKVLLLGTVASRQWVLNC